MSYRLTVLYTTTAVYFENASNIKKEINAQKVTSLFYDRVHESGKTLKIQWREFCITATSV
jgi:hypothetical protein